MPTPVVFGPGHPVWHFVARWAHSAHPEAPLLLTNWSLQTLAAAAQAVANLVVCERDGNAPCGTCKGCDGGAAGHYAAVTTLEGSTTTISIGSLRQALRTLPRTVGAARRVVCVPRAERLSLPAANALLKSLEETRAGIRFVLTTQFPRRLFSTVRSRCATLYLTETPDTYQGPDGLVLAAMLDEKDVLRRLAFINKAEEVRDDDVLFIASRLGNLLRSEGPHQGLRAAFMRIRDYFLVRSSRGSPTMAAEVLIATVAQLRNTTR